MEELKPYIIEFDENDARKSKVYFSDCAIGEKNQWPIIVINDNKCLFFSNDGVCKVWNRKEDAFLQPKGQGQSIMTLDFNLFYG